MLHRQFSGRCVDAFGDDHDPSRQGIEPSR